MSMNWRISTFNGALLAAYFIPTWTIVAFKIMISPVHGFYERPNISVALFISDHLQLAAITIIRFAWLLALGKLTVVAFFAVFLVLIARRLDPKGRRLRRGACDGARDRQPDQLRQHGDGITGWRDRGARLHATELLMLLGTAIVLLVEPAAPPQADSKAWQLPTYRFSSPNSPTIADASLTAWLAAGTPQ